MYYSKYLIHWFILQMQDIPFLNQILENCVSELVHFPDQISSTFNRKNKENCDKQLWVKVNIGQSDFCRINYLAAQLGKPIVIKYSDR